MFVDIMKRSLRTNLSQQDKNEILTNRVEDKSTP